MDGATAPQHAPVIPIDTGAGTCTTPGCLRRSLFPHGTCCPRCPGRFGVAWGHPCHTPGCDGELAALALPPASQPPSPLPTPTPTPTPTHPHPHPTPPPQPARPPATTPTPPRPPPPRSGAPRRSPSAYHALAAIALTAALSLAAPHAGAPRATARLARQPAWLTLLGGALLMAAATGSLPTAHSSPAPAPGGGGKPTHPTRPTTPAPDPLPPLAGTAPCPRLTDHQEDMRQRTHLPR